MSGVVDDKGQQWEHCNGCGKFKRYPQSLGYQKPSKKYPYGRMLCLECVNKLSHWHLARIVPAPEWQQIRSN